MIEKFKQWSVPIIACTFLVFLFIFLRQCFFSREDVSGNGNTIEQARERSKAAKDIIVEAENEGRTAKAGIDNAERRTERIEKSVDESRTLIEQLEESIGRSESIIAEIRRGNQG